MAPGAGPLRAIAIRPQVALPASRALVASASLTGAHLANRSLAASRPGEDTQAVGSAGYQLARCGEISSITGRVVVPEAFVAMMVIR